MIAFHGQRIIKTKYLNRVRAHAAADEIVKGKYWENGKGCAVGCTIHSSNHNAYEIELGIPEWLARVEDTLFEGMSPEKAKQWPAKFLAAIKPGANLEKAKVPFIVMVLESTLKSMKKAKFDKAAFPGIQKAIEGSEAAVREMIRCHKKGLDLSAAESAAWSAARAAELAAESAKSAARSAAWSAAELAELAARSAAWSAAWSAARAAAWAAAWSAAAESAAAYDSYAEKLLNILRGIK